MKFLPICMLLVMCFIAKGSSDSFLCYECENCEETLNDSLLKSCPAATTLPPITQPTQETTTTSSSLATETTTLPPVATETTTLPPVATETTTTPPVATETTTLPPVATETTTLPPVATESTTLPPVATESTTLPPVATESTTLPPAATETTTTPPAATETTTLPPVATESTTLPPVATESTTLPPTAAETSAIPPQSVNSNPIGLSLRRSRSLKSVLREESSYHCFTVNVKEGNDVKTNKGCIEATKNKDACEALKDKYGQSTENCRVCESDRCNSSAALKFSSLIFVITILISVFCK